MNRMQCKKSQMGRVKARSKRSKILKEETTEFKKKGKKEEAMERIWIWEIWTWKELKRLVKT